MRFSGDNLYRLSRESCGEVNFTSTHSCGNKIDCCNVMQYDTQHDNNQTIVLGSMVRKLSQ